ncbi:MAG: hypothetical protein HYT87_14025 [Nitrospirae bacterium]|nr:hypothetical protein [Nitrospirota bacterium]
MTEDRVPSFLSLGHFVRWGIPIGLAAGAAVDFLVGGTISALLGTPVAASITISFTMDQIRFIRLEGVKHFKLHWLRSLMTVLVLVLVEERVRELFLVESFETIRAPGYHVAFYLLSLGIYASRLRKFSEWRAALELRPAQTAVTGFATLILVGAVLLSLPVMTESDRGISFIDALFMSTSAVCVTGLVTVDPGMTFSLPGEIVLMILIQVGGLGIVTLGALLPFLAARRMQLRHELALKETLDLPGIGSLGGVLKSIVIVTFCVEALGALGLYAAWRGSLGDARGLYLAVFHSISAFNNAGFALFPDSLMSFVGSPVVNLVVPGLIIVGGLGFPVWLGVAHWIGWPPRLPPWLRFGGGERNSRGFWAPRGPRPVTSLHLRLVLWTSAVLIALGMVLFLGLEWNHSLAPLSFGQKLWASWFQSVTPRTAGFNTVDFSQISSAAALLVMLFMFVGGSPGGTAGGIKTTTAAVMWMTFSTTMFQRRSAVAFRRTVSPEVIAKATALVFASFGIVIVLGGLVMMVESHPFNAVLFEIVSAFGTVGLSLGITPLLTPLGKILIAVMMFVGRLGPLTLAFALAKPKERGSIEYPEGRLIIG